MRTPVNIRFFGISLAVSIVHFVSGLIIATGVPQALHITVLAIFGRLVHWDIYVAAAIMIASAVIATTPFVHQFPLAHDHPLIRRLPRNPDRLTVILTSIPQQLLCVLHAISIVWAFFVGRYPDGYTPDGGQYFIAVDQLMALSMVLWYILEYAVTLTEATDA